MPEAEWPWSGEHALQAPDGGFPAAPDAGDGSRVAATLDGALALVRFAPSLLGGGPAP